MAKKPTPAVGSIWIFKRTQHTWATYALVTSVDTRDNRIFVSYTQFSYLQDCIEHMMGASKRKTNISMGTERSWRDVVKWNKGIQYK